MSKLTGKSILAAKEFSSNGKTFQVTSPLDQSTLPTKFEAVPGEMAGEILEVSKHAFEDYSQRSNTDRATFLETIADEILALGDELLQKAHEESGLPWPRLDGERARTMNQLKLFAQLIREGSWVDARIDTALPDRQPLARPDLRRMLIPLGPVIVFGASNFPFAFSVAGGDTASALASGCSVIVKAHRGHPGTSELVGQAIVSAIHKCDMPPGVFSLIHGNGADIGTELVRHPFSKACGFTGSHGAGRSLFDVAMSRPEPIPVFAEMSSLNPVVVTAEAIRTRGGQIATGLRDAVNLGSGQFCTKPGLIFGVDSPEWREFLKSLASAFEQTVPVTMLNDGICKSFYDSRQSVLNTKGVTLLAETAEAGAYEATTGHPTLAEADAKTFAEEKALLTEVFGPFILAVTARDEAELLATLSKLEGQLTATIHAESSEETRMQELTHALSEKVGRMLINGYPTGVEVSNAMTHGGPYPATSDSRYTSVGTGAILRFARPITFQNYPDKALPPELQAANPLQIWRKVNGEFTQNKL